ncbi:Hypothetical predicted protein [Octopus vulgaris]|uniref:Zinc finger BED domain-containing protein 5-like n=1 Tax=Octopus vulgaris TaxID=6645 RepID=A0AA36ASD6_OCTVU|nr:Hypothetical predicted protein [Octopus vulgaris]
MEAMEEEVVEGSGDNGECEGTESVEDSGGSRSNGRHCGGRGGEKDIVEAEGLTSMDRFLKKRKLDTDEDRQGLRQSVETAATASDAASSKLPRHDGINLQLKVRQYCENYIALGFTWTGNPDCPSPLCTVCGEKLANSAMAPAKLKQHLTTKHPELSGKNEQYFKKELAFNKRQVSMFAKMCKLSDKGQEASYAVAEIVARKMKSHTIAETVILPACQEIVRIMFGEDAVSELNKIPLSDNIISRRIQDISGDIECNIKSKILKHKLFALQVDESTDITEYCGLNWKDCVGICTDGAPAMIGCLKGFVPIAQKQNPNIIHIHCFIHREALVAKTLGPELKSGFDMYDWIRNPFVEFEPFEEQFTLTEEELANFLNDRTLKLKHSELNLNAFWLLVEKEYPAISQKALRLLVHFSTSYLCEFGFSALTTIKHKKRAQLLSVEDELHVYLSKTRPNLKELCKKHQAQEFH